MSSQFENSEYDSNWFYGVLEDMQAAFKNLQIEFKENQAQLQVQLLEIGQDLSELLRGVNEQEQMGRIKNLDSIEINARARKLKTELESFLQKNKPQTKQADNVNNTVPFNTLGAVGVFKQDVDRYFTHPSEKALNALLNFSGIDNKIKFRALEAWAEKPEYSSKLFSKAGYRLLHGIVHAEVDTLKKTGPERLGALSQYILETKQQPSVLVQKLNKEKTPVTGLWKSFVKLINYCKNFRKEKNKKQARSEFRNLIEEADKIEDSLRESENRYKRLVGTAVVIDDPAAPQLLSSRARSLNSVSDSVEDVKQKQGFKKKQ